MRGTGTVTEYLVILVGTWILGRVLVWPAFLKKEIYYFCYFHGFVACFAIFFFFDHILQFRKSKP